MPPPCPETIAFYYTTTLHIIATVSVPLNIVGFYLVWFESPGMKGYKYCLVYMQTFYHEPFQWICPGYYFFPMIGGYNTGEFFGQFITSHHSMTIWVFVFCFELSAGLSCFVYRHSAAAQINQQYSSRLIIEKTALVLTHIFPFAVSFSLYNAKLTYQQKYDYMKTHFPQCLFWMAFDGFEVYDWHINAWLAVTGVGAFVWIFIIAWYCFFLGVHTMIILQRLKQHMSANTFQMHKAALISLVMQLVIPGVLIIVPLDLCMFVVVSENNDLQELATDSMFLVGSHSLCQCSVMILSNARYRRIVIEKVGHVLKLKCLSRNSVTASLVEPSLRTNSFVRP